MSIFQKIKNQLKHAFSEILLLENCYEILIFKGGITEKTLIGNNFFESKVKAIAFTQKPLQM